MNKQTYRLERIVTDDIKEIFNKKDSFVFLTLFDRFTKLGAEDKKFAEFLRVFKTETRFTSRNEKGLLFDEIDKDLSTKDKQVITDKLNMLENLLQQFFPQRLLFYPFPNNYCIPQKICCLKSCGYSLQICQYM